MLEAKSKVWMDGKLVPAPEASVPILTHALHYGIGTFEGIRCYRLTDGRSAIFRLKEHIRRLFDGLKILSLSIPFTPENFCDACVETVRANALEECYIRPIVYTGSGSMGLAAEVSVQSAIIAWKWGPYLGEEALEKGVRAKISSFNRHHVNVGMVQGKIIGQYVTSVLAKREATIAGYDEAIMLDTHGYVAECSGENIFAVRDGVIFTPPTTSPILPGITRDTVIAIAQAHQMEVRQERFTRDFLYLCDEVFLTGTAAEITPVREVDDRKVGEGLPGPVTKAIQHFFFKVVRGEEDAYRTWLTIIE